MRQYDLIVFDMAGTTVQDNNEVEFCFNKAAMETGLNAPKEKIISMMGWSKIKVFETLWKDQEPDLNDIQLNKNINTSYTAFKEILEHHYINNPINKIAGCDEIFELARKSGIKIALTTGFYRQVTNIILQKLNWELGLNASYVSNGKGIIDCSIASDEVLQGRPAPFMIFRAMELLGVLNVKRVIKIGDTPSDLLAGMNAGVGLNVGVSYGTHTKEQLNAYENDRIIDSIYQIKEYIE